MTPDRWQSVERLYHAASELQADQREPYLVEACGGDEGLRREVEELLQESQAPPGILDQPVRDLLDHGELDAGQTLGPYRILGLLGSGGMGSVYRALDTRLGRTVAIKVSRAGFTGRFRREARAVAALSHPNICTLFDLGPDYLVMELVDGAPIHGPMLLPAALKAAIAIAGALDAAHRKGVVHRDLKPANILMADSGPKLLDFGLAKLEPSPGAVVAESVTLASTHEATIAGTLQYMSPEQLQGHSVDARSDIFSFGLVFFEMLTGRPAFEADNSASLIAAVLTARPTIRALAPELPTGIERILDRALAKDPDDRWQSARDMKAALESVAADVAAPPVRWSSRVAWGVAAVLGVASAGLAWLQWGPAIGPAPGPAPRASAAAARPQLQWFDRSGRILGAVGEPADYSNPALSPDGGRLAVSTRDGQGRRDIWVFDLERRQPVRLTSDPGDETNPVWSPDGSEIIYCSDRSGPRDLYVRRATGGPERLVLASDRNKNPMDWARDGSAVYYNVERSEGGHEIWRLPMRGTQRSPTALLRGNETRDWIALSPAGRLMLYRAGRDAEARIALRPLLSLRGEQPVGGQGISEGHWRADGRQIYFIANNTMMAQDVTVTATAASLGDAVPLFRVRPNTFGRNAFVVSPDGQRFLVRTGP